MTDDFLEPSWHLSASTLRELLERAAAGTDPGDILRELMVDDEAER